SHDTHTSTPSVVHYSHVILLCHASPPPAIFTLSLHDALPICPSWAASRRRSGGEGKTCWSLCQGCSGRLVVERRRPGSLRLATRSEEHTSELQSRENLVCRLLLEKKKSHR